MPDTATPRHALPLLATAQAAKELTHNEALTIIDALLHPLFEGVASLPPSTPGLGDCWRVGVGAGDEWQGQDGTIAVWTAGGWRFVVPQPGMTATERGTLKLLRFDGADWLESRAIAPISGGTVVDVEARTALAHIAATLHSYGLAR